MRSAWPSACKWNSPVPTLGRRRRPPTGNPARQPATRAAAASLVQAALVRAGTGHPAARGDAGPGEDPGPRASAVGRADLGELARSTGSRHMPLT